MSQERRADVWMLATAVQGFWLLDLVGYILLYELLCLRTVLEKGKDFTTTYVPFIKDLPHVGLSDVANKNIEYQLNLSFR